MKRLFPLALFAIIYMTACKDPAQKTKTVFVTDTTKVEDTIIFIRDSMAALSFADSLPSGFYQGTLPCNGCDGLQFTVAFDSSRKFKQEELMWGKQVKPVKKQGSWERKEGLIWLNSGGKVISKFELKNGKLRMVEHYSSPVNSNDSNRYILTKASLAIENPAWKRKKDEGVDFLGIGNEPFWNLEIDNEKFILFKLADWEKPAIVPAEKPKLYNDSTVYTLFPDNLPLRISIFKEYGGDGMSDFLYEYKVVVRHLGQVYTGRGIKLQ